MFFNGFMGYLAARRAADCPPGQSRRGREPDGWTPANVTGGVEGESGFVAPPAHSGLSMRQSSPLPSMRFAASGRRRGKIGKAGAGLAARRYYGLSQESEA